MITATDFTSRGDELMTLVRTNQHLLRAAGVSHPSLDLVCSVVDNVGDGNAATKLTGAGGGGCAMTLLRPDADENLGETIQAALKKSCRRSPWRFSCLTSTVGGDGVLWTDADAFVESSFEKTGSASIESEFNEKSYQIPVAVALMAAAAAMLATRIVSR